MELFSLRSSPSVTRLNSSSRRPSMEKSTFLSGGQAVTFPYNKSCPYPGNLDFRPRTTGGVKCASGSNLRSKAVSKQEGNSKDKDLVFVAGSTGRVGSRTVRELLRLGFRVRAGVRSAKRAETLVQSVQQMKFDDLGNSGVQPVEKLEIVECDLENQEKIGQAVGNASVVICCIGASEKEVFDVTGPYRIDYKASKNLIDAATIARVDHFILLTSLGTNKIGFPAAILNLFWGVLFWKRKAEEALIASGLPYTIVRPGGMERPTDAYKETHNLVLANEDTYFGGQVSNLQVAELMAFMAKHRKLSFCKVVEVIAETTAPLTPMEELLARVPSQRVDIASNDVVQTKQPKSDPEPTATASVSSSNVVKEPTEVEESKTRPLPPYNAYDDWKPPTSPSPNASTAVHSTESNLEMPSAVSSTTIQSSTAHETTDKDHHKQQKQAPLSPFTMYEDLKPPTSPIPSVPKY